MPTPSVDPTPRRARLERACTRLVRRVESVVARLARRPALALWLIGLVALVQAAALTWLSPPVPMIHDEFGYLLAADTFAHGRVSNPTHPLWPWFETFHTIQQPSYVAKYPPGQGLALAVGQVIAGRPIVGGWLASALGCVLVGWMLHGWLPSRWALVGGLLASAHPLVLTWSHSFWGGSVAMAGGALLVGGIGRLLHRPRPRPADLAAVAVGLVVLANSRPFEGLVLAMLTTPWLVVGLRRLVRSERPWRRAVWPATLVLLLGLGGMLGYNLRTTGVPWRMPYMIYEATYSRTPLFYWQRVRPEPVYRHPEMARVHNDWEYGFYRDETASWHQFGAYMVKRVAYFAVYFGAGAFALLAAIALGAWPSLWQGRGPRRWAPAIVMAFFATFFLETARPQGHYAAPIFGLWILWMVLGLRHLAAWRPAGRATGRLLARVAIVACFAALPWVYDDLTHPERDPEYRTQMVARAALRDRLEGTPGRHLVVVRYRPDHPAEQEWVFNEADIDRAKVVWARGASHGHEAELRAYFADRTTWVIEPDGPVDTPR